MHAIVQPASTATVLPSTRIAGPPVEPHVCWHPHVHVDGQSVSVLHAPVCAATHVFQLMARHVLLASHGLGKPGGRTGGSVELHGTVIAVSYGASCTLACCGPHWS
jgi:hypothetical protein